MTATSSSDRLDAARTVIASYDLAPWNVAQSSLAEALRALIEPDAVNETTADIAVQIQKRWNLMQPASMPSAQLTTMLTEAADAGIIAGWNSWEPENAPGTPPVVNRAEYDDLCQIIERAKDDDLSTDDCAAMVLDALGMQA